MAFPLPLGTLVNAGTVIAGSSIGLIFHKGLKDRYRDIIFHAIGLFTLGLGVLMFTKVSDPLIVVLSLIVGGLLGEWMILETRVERFAAWLKKKVKSDDNRFVDGMLSGFMLFCVGSMTIIGTMDEGLRGDHSLLLMKSLMDGFASIGLASSLGAGVLFSAIPLLIYQLALTLLAYFFQGLFTPQIIAQMTALGGALIVGVGLQLLDVKKIRLINILPAIVVVILFTLLNNWILTLVAK